MVQTTIIVGVGALVFHVQVAGNWLMIGLLVVLLATAVTNPHLAIAAALTYALAYTAELGLSLLVYFGTPR